MVQQQDDFVMSRRTLFIMIFVSVAINIFFLLMGMLIGKQDARRSDEAQNASVTQIREDARAVDALDDDLSYFPAAQSEEPPKVLDVPIATESSTPPPNMEAASEGEGSIESLNPEVETSPEATQSKAEPQALPKPDKQSEPPAKVAAVTPAPLAVAKSAESFWLQLTAVGDKAQAEEVRKKASAKGFKAVLINEGGLYKVQVGPYSVRPEADMASQQLKAALGIQAFIKKR